MSLFGDNKAIERLQHRLVELEAAHEVLGGTIRKLELEYIELYDKVRHQMSRMAKRSVADAPPLNNDEVVEEPDDGIDPISRSILARRGMGRAKL